MTNKNNKNTIIVGIVFLVVGLLVGFLISNMSTTGEAKKGLTGISNSEFTNGGTSFTDGMPPGRYKYNTQTGELVKLPDLESNISSIEKINGNEGVTFDDMWYVFEIDETGKGTFVGYIDD